MASTKYFAEPVSMGYSLFEQNGAEILFDIRKRDKAQTRCGCEYAANTAAAVAMFLEREKAEGRRA